MAPKTARNAVTIQNWAPSRTGGAVCSTNEFPLPGALSIDYKEASRDASTLGVLTKRRQTLQIAVRANPRWKLRYQPPLRRRRDRAPREVAPENARRLRIRQMCLAPTSVPPI